MSEPYILLRAALHMFKKSPIHLGEAQLQQVQKQVHSEILIENKVLNSSEAIGVIISTEEVEQAYDEIRGRYADETSFLVELKQNLLDENSLRAALSRQCKINAILDKVGSRAKAINEVDIGLYYHLHKERFSIPERRKVNHILISINPDYPENTRTAAQNKVHELREKLRKKPHTFSNLALKHSECPTALQGGELGSVPRGTLYPELDAVLFTLKPGEISEVVESELGFHILICTEIYTAETVGLAKATAKIRQLMQERAKQDIIRTWLTTL